MNQKRYNAIDGLRAIICLLVIAVHVKANAGYNVQGVFFTYFLETISNLVLMFMTISAFGTCCGYYDKIINNSWDINSFYSKKYRKILPFFAFLCFLDLLVNPSMDSLFEVFANLTLCFGFIPNAHISVIGVGWFLGVIFVFYFIFPFFCFLLSNRVRAWITFVSSIIMFYLCVYFFHTERSSIAYCFVYFMLGGMIFLYRNEIASIKHRYLLLILITILELIYMFFQKFIFLSFAICAFTLIYAICASDKNILCSKPLKLLGGISFEVYLCHMVIFRVIDKMNFLRLMSNDYVNFIFTYIIVVFGAIVFSYAWRLFGNKAKLVVISKKQKDEIT